MNTVLLSLVLVLALATDLWRRRIYNAMLLPFILAGAFFNYQALGVAGLQQSGLGFLLGLGLLFLPFALGGIGGGDVKLLATVGAITGPGFVFYTFLGMALAGGLMSLGLLLYQGLLFSNLRVLGRGLVVMLRSGMVLRSFPFDWGGMKMPYSLAIALGVLLAFLYTGWVL